MVSKANIGLKALQFALRLIIFLCAIVVLAIYAYFLATLKRHDLTIQTWVRAVEGLSGSAALYSLVGVVLLWCLAGHTMASAVALFLDVCFVVCFIYIAAANRAGAGSCSGDAIRTPFGTSAAATKTVTNTHGDVVKIISFRTSCKLETACLAVSIIAALFLVLAFVTEILLARNHRKEKKFGPGPNNNYTSGSGKRRLGLFGFKRSKAARADAAADPNALPLHAEPDHVRASYNTEATIVGAGAHDAGKAEQGRQYGNFEPVRYELPQQLSTAGANTTKTNF
ncbi:hypothetical protein F503_08845 [Ophiostoma piceae UAMH 11346]|uniref:MARVEL domain-containing protein n=1 Tax=Ophiostoma piceae (strain UAMH 11346) TaxID=1262450 RepID=S3C9R9_OPHP1|nr:hypothetical protein F503_08845 [Ophiostoma piceae UAMH 11346]